MYRVYVAEANQRPKVRRSHEIFKKTQEERSLIKALKHTNKSARKLVYGDSYTRYLNVPTQKQLVEAKLVLTK